MKSSYLVTIIPNPVESASKNHNIFVVGMIVSEIAFFVESDKTLNEVANDAVNALDAYLGKYYADKRDKLPLNLMALNINKIGRKLKVGNSMFRTTSANPPAIFNILEDKTVKRSKV
jgi:hypothetical protein